MVTIIPDIRPDAKLNTAQAVKVLGICRESFRLYSKIMGIKKRYSEHSTRPYYLGKDIRRMWQLFR